MGTSLVGLLPQNTYVGLIKVGNNTALNATLKTLSDGAGNDLPMQASTTAINFTGTTTGLASGVSGAIQFSNGSAFASDASNLFWDDTNNRLGVGTNTPDTTATFKGGVAGAVGTRIATLEGSLPELLFKDTSSNSGFAVTKYGSVIYFTNTNGSGGYTSYCGLTNTSRQWSLGHGSNPLAQVDIKGSGSTSATTSLLVQNSAGSELAKVRDDGSVFYTSGYFNIQTSAVAAPSSGAQLNLNISGNGPGMTITNQNATTYRIGQYNTGNVLSIGDAGASTPVFNINTSGNIGVGTTTPNASAICDITSTTKGVLFPRMTTTQKNAIASPAAGLVVYDSTAKSPGYYDGANWGYTGGALQNTTGNGGTLNVSFAAGNIVNLTLNATTTLAFANSVIGTYIIQVTQSAGGGSSLVYPASVKWSGGTAPTLSTAVGKTDILTFYYDGTNYYGNYSLNY